MEPTAELLALPREFGRATRKLAWATVRAELEQATQYWIATSRADGRTHMVPVDGLWLDDVLFYGGSAPAVHLPDPVKAVIVPVRLRLDSRRAPRSSPWPGSSGMPGSHAEQETPDQEPQVPEHDMPPQRGPVNRASGT
jgi:hypothetical protein